MMDVRALDTTLGLNALADNPPTERAEFIFTTDVTCKIEFNEDTVGNCASCDDEVHIWEDGYIRGTDFYCEGCDEDNFFFCEGCCTFYNRSDQYGYNWCMDCAVKGGGLIWYDFLTAETDPRLRAAEKWIQENVNPDYTWEQEFHDYHSWSMDDEEYETFISHHGLEAYRVRPTN